MTAATLSSKLTVISFEAQYAGEFARLNYEWLNAYFNVEPHDSEMLDHPQAYIIDKGGEIFFAKLGEEIVGTVALIVETDDTYELAKMAVNPDHRGLKIGQVLMDAALDYSKKKGMRRVVLESNTKLTPAINLYIKNGFKAAPLNACSPYARCNIRMERFL